MAIIIIFLFNYCNTCCCTKTKTGHQEQCPEKSQEKTRGYSQNLCTKKDSKDLMTIEVEGIFLAHLA